MTAEDYIIKIKHRLNRAHSLLDKHKNNEHWSECLIQEGKILAYEMILGDWPDLENLNK